MALLLALGLALIILASCAPREWAANTLREVGGACLIAALLGFTVHEWLSSQIARDAFEGAMGYVLQENLREEIKWITRIDRIARKFDLTITIEPIDDKICKITTATYKVIENISDRPINLTAMLRLDDWGYEQKKI
jgi:hypothetical protein